MVLLIFFFFALNPKHIHFRYEAPVAPNVEVLRQSAVEAFPTAIVGFAVAFSVAKVYSIKHDYIIDGNQVSTTENISRQGRFSYSRSSFWLQELIAFGVSNMFGAAFKSFAASTALSRTAVQESSGGKTQVREGQCRQIYTFSLSNVYIF